MELGISNNQYLGRYELQQLQSFLKDEGYQKFIKDNATYFGLVNNSINGNFTNARVTEGIGDNTIKYAAILGIDYDGKFIVDVESGDISVGSSGADVSWYWVKLVRAESYLETGTISIGSDGSLTGSGTDFLTSMRGKTTDFPTKITFPNSSLNTGEYEVLSVTDNTTAQLNVVSMSIESDQEWRIIPTNTPGAVLTTEEKKLFKYDSATVSLVAESGLTLVDGLPQQVDGEYWLARVQNNGGTGVNIEDKRSNYIFKTVDGYFTSNLDKSANPLIGIEAIKFAATTDPRDKNIVELAFGMRSTNWSYDDNQNRVTIIAGQGGKFKDTTDFTNDDFNGWRLYFESGKYAIIKDSTLSGSQINLDLDSLDPAELSNGSQQLLVVPDCSEVEIYLTPSSTTPLAEIKKTYPVNTDLCRIEVPVTTTTSNYIVTYRHKHIREYGAILTIHDDSSTGYYTEASFNDDGSLKSAPDRVQQTYTSGTITLTRATNAYSVRISSVETGDRFGVRTLTLDAGTVNNQLVVGNNYKEQIFTTSSQVTLTANKYINLRTTGAVAGNQFFLQFEADVVLDGNEFEIVQEWDGSSALVDSGSINRTLFTFDDFYLNKSASDSLLLRCTFDGTDWKVDALSSSSASGWTTMSPTSTGTTTLSESLQYRIFDNNLVFLRGFITLDGGDNSADEDICTLPIGARPSRDMAFNACNFLTTSASNDYQLLIESSGGIIKLNGAAIGLGSDIDVYLNGISFFID